MRPARLTVLPTYGSLDAASGSTGRVGWRSETARSGPARRPP